MNKQALIDQIHQAFADVKLEDGVGLWQGQGMDDYADGKTILELRRKDEKDDWRKMSFEDMNRCYSSLSFFDAKGMRFHLPQFMICNLMEDALTDFSCEFDLMFHLGCGVSGNDYSEEQFSALDRQQIACVISFLEFHLQEIVEQSEENRKLYGVTWKLAHLDSEYLELKDISGKWQERLK